MRVDRYHACIRFWFIRHECIWYAYANTCMHTLVVYMACVYTIRVRRYMHACACSLYCMRVYNTHTQIHACMRLQFILHACIRYAYTDTCMHAHCIHTSYRPRVGVRNWEVKKNRSRDKVVELLPLTDRPSFCWSVLFRFQEFASCFYSVGPLEHYDCCISCSPSL
jgi:hypothetical protein